MKVLGLCLQESGALFAVISAILWWIAAWKQPTPFYQGGIYLGPPPDNSKWGEAWRLASKFNAAAAFCTGVAAFLGGLGTLIQLAA